MPTPPDHDAIRSTRSPARGHEQQSSRRQPEADLRTKLFKHAMNGNWKEVEELCTSKKVWAEKITRHEDTVLHFAVSGGDESIVLRLLKALGESKEAEQILRLKNDGGSTPLHLAASLGMETACWKMAKLCPALVVEARNKRGETPLFTAVRNGKKEAFFALESFVGRHGENNSHREITHCRRDFDGCNILHYAIYGEHFGLAHEIIELYPWLVNFKNTRGESALHYLANKPSVFGSGTRLGIFETLIYPCITVKPLEIKYPSYKNKKHKSHLKDHANGKDTVIFFKFLASSCDKVVSIIPQWIRTKCHLGDNRDGEHTGDSASTDILEILVNSSEETGSQGIKVKEGEVGGVVHKKKQVHGVETGSQGIEAKEGKVVDVIHKIFDFFMRILLLILLGIGLWKTHAIEKKKKKHFRAKNIMTELVEHSKHWEYEEGGSVPKDKLAETMRPPLEVPTEISEDSNSTTKAKTETEGDSTKVSAVGKPQEMLRKILDGMSIQVQDIKAKVVVTGTEETLPSNEPDGATPVLIAAKKGITEMVTKILDAFPVAVLDEDKDEKNILLLAVEHRQAKVFDQMCKRKVMKETVFGKVDKDGNSALHLAAMLRHSHRPWSVPGAALQMQWEIKWYKYVQGSAGQADLFATYNNDQHTALELFMSTHENLVKDGTKWLVNTAQSCSVVAALIATVAFASATAVPGGVDSSGLPILDRRPAFKVYVIMALAALCFSVMSLVMFLAILTSRYQERDFERRLPVKLIVGLTSLFMSISAVLASFCAGDFFVVEHPLKIAAYPMYAIICFPIILMFAFAQLPLYVDLLKATFKRVPQQREKMEQF